MTAINEWQTQLAKIYPNGDKSPDYMLAHIFTSSSDLGRLILRGESDQRRDRAVIGVLSWMMALATHFKVDLESALLARFPGVCSYCLQGPCVCDVTERRAYDRDEALSEFKRNDILKSRYVSYRNVGTEITFTWFFENLCRVYPINRALLLRGGGAYVVAKMLEEGGELHRAYSSRLLGRGVDKDIETELADLAAWVVSCWDLSKKRSNLDAEIAGLYALGCPTCRKVPCSCPTYSITMGQEEVIRRISELLRTLKPEVIALAPIADTIEAAETAAIAPSAANKVSLSSRLSKLLQLAKSTNEGAEAVKGIADNLTDLAAGLSQWTGPLS